MKHFHQARKVFDIELAAIKTVRAHLDEAALTALKREGHKAASSESLSSQARSAARRRTAADRSAAARKAARTRKARS